jgi:DNA-binding LacI/PurR family transcriptional regulator
MREVADRAGVSVATVSRVINNESSVSAHIREAVEEAIDELHYEPKLTVSDRKGDAYRIGLIIPDITNPYFPCLIEGISKAASVHGAEIILGNSSEDTKAENYYFNKFLDSGINGIIYIPFSTDNDPLVKELAEKEFPIVFLDREASIENVSSVTSNNEEGAYQATTYLLSLGHRDILFISGPSHYSTSTSRLAGYKRGLEEYGIDCRNELIVHGDTKQESGFLRTQEFLRNHTTAVTAIFASNDFMAFGAWKAVEQLGYKIPDDISVIGYDDIYFSKFISLTTIAQPGFEIGRNSLLLLIDLINKRRQPPHKIVLRDSLIIRRSCKKI